MRYEKVFINSISYELPSEKITTRELELRLQATYDVLGIPMGQLESLSKIRERRYWPPHHRLSDGAAVAGRKALSDSNIEASDSEMLIYCGVGRDFFEPATACAVANKLQVSPRALIYDVSNACLGVLNGILQVANAIELGQIQTGLVVSAESCREIIDTMIEEINQRREMKHFMLSLSTLTGGSGAIAIVLSNRHMKGSHKLVGGVARQESKWHELCRWGVLNEDQSPTKISMQTDAIGVLNNGIALGKETYSDFLQEMPWNNSPPGKFICHQVGDANQLAIRKALAIPSTSDFTTYQTLGNTGTVALPITAAIANDVGFLLQGDRVGFLGIGSGLNCIMIGIEW